MADNEVAKPTADADQQSLLDAANQAVVADEAARRLAKQPRTLKDIVSGKEFENALKQVLPPKAMKRFLRQMLTALLRNPDLAECSKESFFKCAFDLALSGLEPDGRHAHLIPYRNNKVCRCGHDMETHRGQECSKCNCKHRQSAVECTLIFDYKGIVQLVRRSGDVSYIHADVVYNNDEWSYAYGTEAHLKHKPKDEDRGSKRVAFYSYVRLKDGSEDFIVLSPAEVEKVRKRSKAANSGPWVTDFDEMGKKTAFRRHSKWLPLSPEVRDAIEKDEDAIDISGFQEILESPQMSSELPEGQPQRKSLKETMMGAEQPEALEGKEA